MGILIIVGLFGFGIYLWVKAGDLEIRELGIAAAVEGYRRNMRQYKIYQSNAKIHHKNAHCCEVKASDCFERAEDWKNDLKGLGVDVDKLETEIDGENK
ncbi:hypothetical protein SAMN05216326_12547 [Nitrosomonas marina]|uniref:Uncharacterized protein n=1 Tax=Nitrosomonas marina TaxID=917 RepID=A0A1I0E805_9PROT|nr:hypothetical protein [Nitrosomonas marina]SET41003.1 hypothetical protein SAMN05216326_12547 [Nitrosomonas marina]